MDMMAASGVRNVAPVTFLVPAADGIAAAVAGRVPDATVLRYEEAVPPGPGQRDLGAVAFYCLPYMGGPESIALAAKMPGLRVLQTLNTGVDDVLAAVPDHATLCNGRGLHHEEGAAEMAVSLILASLRRIPEFVRQQDRREWRHFRTDSLDGKRVLLVGYGTIGAQIEQRLLPFGAVVTRASRTPRPGVEPLSQLATLAAAADILVACIALTPLTRGLISATVLDALPSGALVVNVGRGPLIDAAALSAHLTAGRLRAALDVTDPEPLPAGRPEWALPNVLISPHVGGDTPVFGRRSAEFVAAQARRFRDGQPLGNVVKPAAP
jgi:phosphoglycerate dehydrogenase-like enzyme